jgi:hypothetical protein
MLWQVGQTKSSGLGGDQFASWQGVECRRWRLANEALRNAATAETGAAVNQ